MVTILHLSDLHRSHSEPINNDTLLSSLLADKDRYLVESPRIKAPDFAVISGDIIQGVRVGESNFSAELAQQYEVATDFLGRLADLFFGGDRSKIAIVPGNHDVCWNTALSAMEKVEKSQEPAKVGPHLFGSGSLYRWSWNERQIYKIKSNEVYAERLQPYRNFISSFYDGVELAYQLDPAKSFNFYQFDSGRILLTAFSSIHGNDCFCNHGAIQQGAIGTCSLRIRDMFRQPLLKIALWHHSLQGPPDRDDYMDPFAVHEMLGAGFKLGLHGHQHQADAAAYNIHLPEEQSIAIISAGSLCAGANELPRGTNRQYNIIEISDDYLSARVYVREMAQGNQFGRCRQGLFAPDGFVDMSWEDKNSDSASWVAKFEKFEQQTVVQAEDALRAGGAENAFALLASVDKTEGSHARRLYLEAAKALDKWPEIVEFLNPPSNIDEFFLLLQSHESAGNLPLAACLIQSDAEKYGIDQATSAALLNRNQLRQALGK